MDRKGFSTGALAKGDFRTGIQIEHRLGATVIELSALRDSELHPLLRAISDLLLNNFKYISFHAPSRLVQISEPEAVAALAELPLEWPIILHPDVIKDYSLWKTLGGRLCIENMDQRKQVGRTVPELERVFQRLPEASFCFDIGHARQVDPTMGIAVSMLRRFGDRLRQIHMSEVDPQGSHIPMSFSAVFAFRRVAKLIPESCPVILEAVVAGPEIAREVSVARFVLGAVDEQEASRAIPFGWREAERA